MNDDYRTRAREIAQRHLSANDAVGWFDELYSSAQGNVEAIPWANSVPNPNLLPWLERRPAPPQGATALVVGCGLGDDAEEFARRGYATTAFDISPTAIAWCRKRFSESRVDYCAENLLLAPHAWLAAFDFVFECFTLQSLPPDIRAQAFAAIAGFVAPGGELLVIARGRDPHESEGGIPWRLTRDEFGQFTQHGLEEQAFDDFMDHESPPVRRFRILYKAPVPTL